MSPRASAGRGELSAYQEKRRFDRTPEPAGERAAADSTPGTRRFVVQRHRARRLHYDFRLEIDGVLVSWAVPKGLTLAPGVRHLAVHVEDHPVAYADFEGVIPAGEYGGGDVIVWDRGTWDLHNGDDAATAVDEGELHLELHGEKLKGHFVLVRTRDQGKREQWIVLHKKGDDAVAGWDPEDHPRSVLSGRTNDEVAANPERTWTRDDADAPAGAPSFAPPTPEELEELAGLGTSGTWHFQDQELELTNLDKVLFPARESGEAPVTKRELIRYHACIAPVMLPYLLDRPLNLLRVPDGVEHKSFWQKAAPRGTPEWIARWRNPEADEGESEWYLVADSPPALVWLAQQAAVEVHPWTSRRPDVHHPDYALVDIDPGDATSWEDLLVLARLHRTALEHLNVRGYPKTSGRRGLQVWIPIERGPTFDETRAWVEQLSRTVAAVVGDLVSDAWDKKARHGRARLDYTQNAINKTLVAPYSVRAAAGAPVSMPITWDELDDPALRSDRWTIRTALDRVGDVGDVMAPVLTDPQRALPAFE